MDTASLVMVLTIFFALLFNLANGWNDAANAIATGISTRALRPWTALFYGAVLNFAGALFSSAVAQTIGQEVADPRVIGGGTFLAAVMVAPIWVTYCTLRGLPISCSHALMGGLIGAVLAAGGAASIKTAGLEKIVFGVFASPIIGFFLGYALLVLFSWLFRRARPGTVTGIFRRLQVVSCGFLAFSHGTGDAQKAMGIISGALIANGCLALGPDGQMPVPFWVRLTCAMVMGLGTAVGGWEVMRTLGSRLAHLKPHQGFCAEAAASATILANTLSGVPISTTHSITGAIMGVGAARGIKAVKWGVGRKIVFAWIFTFPACIVAGALVRLLLGLVGL